MRPKWGIIDMTQKNEIIEWVGRGNTNPAVLGSMLDNYTKPVTPTITIPVYKSNGKLGERVFVKNITAYPGDYINDQFDFVMANSFFINEDRTVIFSLNTGIDPENEYKISFFCPGAFPTGTDRLQVIYSE